MNVILRPQRHRAMVSKRHPNNRRRRRDTQHCPHDRRKQLHVTAPSGPFTVKVKYTNFGGGINAQKRLILILFALFFATTAWAVSPAYITNCWRGNGCPQATAAEPSERLLTPPGMQTPSAATICYVKPITMDCDDTGGKFCARLYMMLTQQTGG
jgi:hypothetical protein